MAYSLVDLHSQLFQLSSTILTSLSHSNYTPSQSTTLNPKSLLQTLLSNPNPNPNCPITETHLQNSIKDFTLACSLLSSSLNTTHELLSWIPNELCVLASSAFEEFSRAYCGSGFGERNGRRVSEMFGLDCCLVSEERRLGVEVLPEVLPLLKEGIKESCVDKGVDGDEGNAGSGRCSVGFAIVAAYQFRWFVTQVDYPHLGKLCSLVIPCGLTALDHWSPEVKGQGMISFIHLAKNVNTTELSWYEDVILDACCQNIASDDEIWSHAVEMSVLLVTYTQRSNPRSQWFERMLNEMLGHLERQPRNKDRRIVWLKYVEPLFHATGLVLLAHFRRIFPLFFQWMHADDNETILLVLKRVQMILRLTWIRNSPYIERLVEELVQVYKEAALKTDRDGIRTNILEILIILQQCNSLQFETSWDKHKDDPNLTNLNTSLRGENTVHDVAARA
ncbi:ARM repeat superfamily protein [Euphorbia peplus]|nr:ARM repeat superfamily protein [Euphorbia peplus]